MDPDLAEHWDQEHLAQQEKMERIEKVFDLEPEVLEAIFSNLTDNEIEQWVKKTIPAPEEEG